MMLDHFSFVLRAKALVESHGGHLTRNEHGELTAIIGHLSIALLLQSKEKLVGVRGSRITPRLTYGTRHYTNTYANPYSGISYTSTSPERILKRIQELISIWGVTH